MSRSQDFFVESFKKRICERLAIDDPHFIEIESKKRVVPRQAKDLKKHISKQKNTQHDKSTSFFDQFLDTPEMDLFRLGASLRLRYKRNATRVYLQYKGPGYLENGLLYRSEFSSGELKKLIREESRHDIIQFSHTSFRQILHRFVHSAMARAMRRHLGKSVIDRISSAPIVCIYQKEKFIVDLGSAFLEPSVDRVCAFHITRSGPYPLSTFYEFENEIKAEKSSFHAKIDHIPELLKYNAKLAQRFDLKAEPLDKYHRCASIFLPHRRKKIGST